MTTDEGVVGRQVSDQGGRFFVRVTAAGTYRLRARRIGYEPFTTDPMVLARGQDKVVEIRLQPRPIPLDSIDAIVDQPVRRLARVGFYNRLAKGFGYFRTPQDLEERRPVIPSDLFWGVSGVRMLRDGRVVSSTSPGRCALSVAVDGMVVQQGGRGGGSSSWTELVPVSDIEAVEIYAQPGGVPAWLAGSVSPCGALVIWTKGSLR